MPDRLHSPAEGGLDFKGFYEAEESAGYRPATQAAAESRLAGTLGFLGKEFGSLLDAGCGEGYFLGYVRRHRPGVSLRGVELAENRVRKALATFPDLEITQGDISALPFADDHSCPR